MNRMGFLMAAAVAAVAMNAAAKAPFGDGETLVYNVSWRAALIPPVNMMKVTVRTLEEEAGGVKMYHVVGSGRTAGAAKSFVDVNDTYHTWLDARTLLPSRTASDVREDNYRMTSTHTYDWNAMKVTGVRRNNRWEEEQRTTFALAPGAGDALSLLYRLRATDLGALTPGRDNVVSLVLGEGAKPIVFRLVGREEVKIRKTGRVRALKFTCTMATSDGSTYEEGMVMTAWISDDENHVPLMVESPVRIGRVTVTLAEGSRTIKPMKTVERQSFF